MKMDYINVDLVIKSYDDLTPIAEDFGEDVVTLYCGEVHSYKMARFTPAIDYGDPNAAVQHLVQLVESIYNDDNLRKLWIKSFSKIFDIRYGCENTDDDETYTSELRPDTITRISKINASVQITIYPPNVKPNVSA